MQELRLRCGGWMGVRGKFADEEFLDDVLDTADADTDGGAFEDKAGAGAVGRWVVGVGEAVRRHGRRGCRSSRAASGGCRPCR